MRAALHPVDVPLKRVAGTLGITPPGQDREAKGRRQADEMPHAPGVRRRGGLRLSGWGYNRTQLQQRKEHVFIMGDGPVIVRDGDGGSNAAAVGIVIVVVVALLIALFVWHPWNTNSSTTTNTTITQPAAGGAGGGTTKTTTSNNGG